MSARNTIRAAAALAIALMAVAAAHAGVKKANTCELTASEVNFSYVGSVWNGQWHFAFEFSLPKDQGIYDYDRLELSGFAEDGQIPFYIGRVRGASRYRMFSEAPNWSPRNSTETLAIGSCEFEVSVKRMKILPIRIAVVGDSFASGEGNPPFKADQACHRTTVKSWPALLNSGYSAFEVHNFACSGATIDAIFGRYRSRVAQLDQLRQLAAKEMIDAVVVSISGNDAGFGKVVYDCWRPRRNCAADGMLAAANGRIGEAFRGNTHDRLVDVYNQIHEATGAYVFAMKYPHLFPEAGSYKCSWLARDEQRGLNMATDHLNKVIDYATQDTYNDYVGWVDTTYALAGHELCTRDSWVNPIGRLPKEYDGHPNFKGQEAMADAIRRYLLSIPALGISWP